MNVQQFIYLWAGCFQGFYIINNVSMNILMHISWYTQSFSYQHLWLKLLEHRVYKYSILQDNDKLLFKWSHYFLWSPGIYKRKSGYTFSLLLGIMRLLDFSHVNDYFSNSLSDNILLVHRNATDLYRNATFWMLILHSAPLLH